MLTKQYCDEVKFYVFMAMQECVWYQRQHSVFYGSDKWTAEAFIHDSCSYIKVK